MELSDVDVIEHLEQRGVLQESDGSLQLTNEFEERFAMHIANSETTGENELKSFVNLDEKSRWFKQSVSGYLEGLRNFDLDLSEEELVTIALSLVQAEEPSSDWSNQSFFPLSGDELPSFVATSGSALVLVYKPECEPCDHIRSKIETLLEEEIIPMNLPIIEVSGPDYSHFLHDEYDVVGAPTLLFFKESRVELRLAGDKHIDQIRSDIKRVYGISKTGE